jgi:hypothetical protein
MSLLDLEIPLNFQSLISGLNKNEDLCSIPLIAHIQCKHLSLIDQLEL